MDPSSNKQPADMGFATIAIALMGIGLAAGLDYLGTVGHLDNWVMAVVVKPGFSAPEQSLDPYLIWGVTVVLVPSLTAVMLNVSGGWRRLLIWVLALIVTFFWVPVLLLAAYEPEIGVVLVGLLWSGCCAMVYSTNHEMPADLIDQNPAKQDDAKS
jgi:hypothetical protein